MSFFILMPFINSIKRNFLVLPVTLLAVLLLTFKISAESSISITASVREGVCGDGVVEVGQQCEEGELLGKTCKDFGFIKGELKCGKTCKFDTTSCYNPPLFKNTNSMLRYIVRDGESNIQKPHLIKQNFLELFDNLKYNRIKINL